jgi:hypothetical protein
MLETWLSCDQAKKARERVYTSALPTVTGNIIKVCDF